MVRLTKIYTKAGDGGLTRLVGGQQVPKENLRIEAYGTVDELNATIGLAREALGTLADEAARASLKTFFNGVQNRLFDLGSDLATLLEDRYKGQRLVEAGHVESLEEQMDNWNSELNPLESFVLPGGNELAARLHLARTVCRRAERRITQLAREEQLGEFVVPYINRLSDALFVASRWVVHRNGDAEILWGQS